MAEQDRAASSAQRSTRSRLFLLSLLGLATLAVSLHPIGARLAGMVRHLTGLARGREPSGPCPTVSRSLTLPGEPDRAGAPPVPITVRVWRPASSPDEALAACAIEESGRNRRRSIPGSKRPLLLYTPGNGAGGGDGATTAVHLASHGFIVAALDDVEQDAGRAPASGDRRPGLRFDFSSREAYEATLATAASKVDVQARRALRVLDTLTARAAPSALGTLRIDEARIGAFGFSLGGATAAEAATLDGRIAAVANLDGWLFGRAARDGLDQPYLFLMDDDELPDPEHVRHAWEHYEALLTERDLRAEARLGARAGSGAYRLVGSVHETFSEQILQMPFLKAWLRADQDRLKRTIDACLLSFFNHRLTDDPARIAREQDLDCGDAYTLVPLPQSR